MGKENEYPHLRDLFADNASILRQRIVIQEEGEAIFVPSMWFHEVYNLSEVVLSVNHNWFNGFSITLVWNHIHSEYVNVRDSLEDLKDILDGDMFYDQCQELM